MNQFLGIFVLCCGLATLVAGICLLVALPFIWLWNYAVVAAVSIAVPIDNFWVGFWLMMFISFFLVSSRSKS